MTKLKNTRLPRTVISLALALVLLLGLMPAQSAKASPWEMSMWVTDTQTTDGKAALLIYAEVPLEKTVNSFTFSIPKSKDGATLTSFEDVSGFSYQVTETDDLYIFQYSCPLTEWRKPLLLLHYDVAEKGLIYPLMPTLRETAKWFGPYWNDKIAVQGDSNDYQCVKDYGSIHYTDEEGLSTNSGSYLVGMENGVAVGSTVTMRLYNHLSGSTEYWSSSDPEIASVDDSGVVTGVKPGTATITCYTVKETSYDIQCKSAAAQITVREAEPEPEPEPEVIPTLKGGKITNLTNKVGRKLYVKWSKDKNATGYILQYATNKGFTKNAKTVEISKNTTTSKTIKSLKKNKTYYVRVCSYYQTSDGERITGTYSKVKKLKITK